MLTGDGDSVGSATGDALNVVSAASPRVNSTNVGCAVVLVLIDYK